MFLFESYKKILAHLPKFTFSLFFFLNIPPINKWKQDKKKRLFSFLLSPISRLHAVCWKWMGNKIDSNKHLSLWSPSFNELVSFWASLFKKHDGTSAYISPLFLTKPDDDLQRTPLGLISSGRSLAH